MFNESVPTEDHQRLVHALAKYLRDNLKLELKGVSHDQFTQKPWEFNGKIPDVVAYNSESQLYSLGEAELCEDIASEHTKGQLMAWNNLSMNGGKSNGIRVPIYVIVPKVCSNNMSTSLSNWGLRNRVTQLDFG